MSVRITVIGTGYLGATHAAAMASLGFDTLGVDVDAAKIASLSTGKAPFHEKGLDDLLTAGIEAGKLAFTGDFAAAGEFGDVHFLCVGTPQLPGGTGADTRYLDAAVDALAPHLTRPCLVVGKSTVPVGTATRLRERLRATAPAGEGVDLVWNPEFLRESLAIHDTLHPDRIVLGTDDEAALGPVLECYASMLEVGTPLIVTDFATAELVKVAANAFLATKISYINAMSEVCEAAGADVLDLATALGHDVRIGAKFLHPGLGFGGGCLPKDIRAFRTRATELGAGAAVSFLDDVDAINLRRRTRVVQLVADLAGRGGSLDGVKVAILGAAFKPGTDDVRDAPGLDVAVKLEAGGAQVRVYDPAANATSAAAQPHLTYVEDLTEAVRDADVVVVATEWKHFTQADPHELGALVASKRLVDARNAMPTRDWVSAGWQVASLGRPTLG